jgi:uncharacterized protein YndB with AHSA1/START domain
MAKSIEHKLFFPQPPQVVWEYLTKSELMEQWLMKNDFLPIPGYDFTFQTRPMPDFNFDGIVYCKVLEIVPFKKLSYSWKSGPGNRQVTVDSVVVWELHPKDDGTTLSLVHTGFRELEDFNMYSIMNDGWLKNMHKMAALINTAIHGTTNA